MPGDLLRQPMVQALPAQARPCHAIVSGAPASGLGIAIRGMLAALRASMGDTNAFHGPSSGYNDGAVQYTRSRCGSQPQRHPAGIKDSESELKRVATRRCATLPAIQSDERPE